MKNLFEKIDYKKYFENKKITKQGFGILGRGLGVVKFLLKNNANVLVTDSKSKSLFTDQILELENWMIENNISKNNLNFVFGEHRVEDFINCDYVISASGVPKDNIYLLEAKNKNIPVYQESSLFLKIIMDFNNNVIEEKIKIITITGTRGKTTTTQLIYKILKDNIKDREIYLGGNIQGISTIEILEKIKEKDIVVMETDSWLAQGFEDIKFGPDVAIFTNLMRDHMNYYKGDMSDYFSDKAKTFLYQNQDSTLIANEDLKKYIEEFLKPEYKERFENSKNKKIFITKEDIDKDREAFESPLEGEHNRLNISLAVRAGIELGINIDSIKDSVKRFNGVSGRLEFVKEINGVKYYNDTTATTGEAVVAALDAFKDKDNKLILITGGTDKELDIENYTNKLIEYKRFGKIKKLIFLSNETTTGTKKVLDKMSSLDFNDYVLVKDLSEGVDLARKSSEPTDIILFSPGFASFGMFLNEYDRGEKFLELI
ncbi:MAG: UDP-N-acetylmuramoylalanine--D-glutamate ligase [Patescibacteria group bacterium]|nr:UDP-N-acetylmuramoylalanine--D-glutamate ligase [Patescibacteria group bacterium]